jgi:hypothetical protein
MEVAKAMGRHRWEGEVVAVICQRQPSMNNPLNESAEMMFAPERYKTSIHFVFLFLWRSQHGKVRFRLLSWFRRTGERRVEPTLPQFLEPVVQAPFSSMR